MWSQSELQECRQCRLAGVAPSNDARLDQGPWLPCPLLPSPPQGHSARASRAGDKGFQAYGVPSESPPGWYKKCPAHSGTVAVTLHSEVSTPGPLFQHQTRVGTWSRAPTGKLGKDTDPGLLTRVLPGMWSVAPPEPWTPGPVCGHCQHVAVGEARRGDVWQSNVAESVVPAGAGSGAAAPPSVGSSALPEELRRGVEVGASRSGQVAGLGPPGFKPHLGASLSLRLTICEMGTRTPPSRLS